MGWEEVAHHEYLGVKSKDYLDLSLLEEVSSVESSQNVSKTDPEVVTLNIYNFQRFYSLCDKVLLKHNKQ